MENTKMQLVLHNGAVVDVDTSFLFNNQYNTIDGKRIGDAQVKRIINDVRLGEFYCCPKKQGTYEEVLEAIKEERSKINQCSECWYWQTSERVPEECYETSEVVDGKLVTRKQTVYKYACKYGKDHCIHDINEKPQLFRDVQKCFFCEHPNGIPDMTALKQFMIDNHEKYQIVPCYSDGGLDINNSFECAKKFGSFTFVSRFYNPYFEVSNRRTEFRFFYDLENNCFILCDTIGYTVQSRLNFSNSDKFMNWFMSIVNDFDAPRS